MAPVFLYNARNYFIDNTKIFMGVRKYTIFAYV